MTLFASLRSNSTAIVLFLLGGVALVSLPTAFAASINTYPGFLSADEIDHFTSVNVDKEGIWYKANKGIDAAALDPAISVRLHNVTGTPVTAEEQRQYRRSITITKITGSTQAHLDYYVEPARLWEPVVDKVAFIMLNDNAHAKFIHGTTEVSAKAGKLIVFDGNVQHNTEIARGSLSLAGPIHLRSLSVVAAALTTCGTDDDCCDPAFPTCSCDTESCSGRRLLEQRSQFLRKLNEVHERESSAAEEGEANSDGNGPGSDANVDVDNSHRRLCVRRRAEEEERRRLCRRNLIANGYESDSDINFDPLDLSGRRLGEVLETCIVGCTKCGVCVAPAPSLAPSVSLAPSDAPSLDPSGEPSDTPSIDPSGAPSLDPSDIPSLDPSGTPSRAPSGEPSLSLAPSDTPSLLIFPEKRSNKSSKSLSANSTKSTKSPSAKSTKSSSA